MEKINFSDCTTILLEKKFGLKSVEKLPHLEEWLSSDFMLSSTEEDMIKRLTSALSANLLHWNEQDLSMHFIGPLFSIVNFTERYRFNLFAQRNIEATIDETELGGRVDELIASGFREPNAPFFAFNEYKKETDPNGEPAGQALAAMLVGTIINKDDKSMYGCYIVGASWRFMLLDGKKYAISGIFDGTNYQDTCQIVRILFKLKEYCMGRTADLVVK